MSEKSLAERMAEALAKASDSVLATTPSREEEPVKPVEVTGEADFVVSRVGLLCSLIGDFGDGPGTVVVKDVPMQVTRWIPRSIKGVLPYEPELGPGPVVVTLHTGQQLVGFLKK